jgi:hypothetical protein
MEVFFRGRGRVVSLRRGGDGDDRVFRAFVVRLVVLREGGHDGTRLARLVCEKGKEGVSFGKKEGERERMDAQP